MKKKDYYNYLILTGIVFVIYMILTHFTYVFGSDTDWINQHTIIPDYFRQLFYKTGNLIPSFSFNYGGGQNIFNLSYYGFLSPIILPSYLHKNLISVALSMLTLLNNMTAVQCIYACILELCMINTSISIRFRDYVYWNSIFIL